MLIRILDLILIFAVIIGGTYYLIHTYVIVPRRNAEKETSTITDSAIKKARVDYKEIRKDWLNYSLQKTPEFFASSMDDMSIPEVARFQKLMVVLNDKYDDLPDDMETDVSFVTKVTALRSAYEEAVFAAKKKSL